MVNSYVGETYKLVFPLLSKGYLNLNFSNNNIDTTSDPNVTTLSTIWKHTDSFTLEAVITPYDVNGDANRTTGNGVLTSTKTPPYPNDSLSSRASTYQSTALLGREEQTSYTVAPHKLMIFYNTNLKLYLENTTLGSYNQPAEYKVVAQLTKGGITKTIESETAIKSNEILFNKYDPDGYYVDNSTRYTKLTSSASNVSPSAVVTISGSGLPVNTSSSSSAATATLTCSDHNSSTPASSPVGATATIDIGGSGTDFTVPADSGVTFATGQIVIKSILGNTTSASENKELIIYNDGTGSSDTFKFYPRTSGNNGDALSAINFGTRAFGYRSEGTLQTTTNNLVAAINAVSGLDITANSPNPNSGVISLISDTPHSNFNNTITIGSALSATATTTLASNYTNGSTSLVLTDASSFSSTGTGTISGISFSWSAKSSNTLTVTSLGANYSAGVNIVQIGTDFGVLSGMSNGSEGTEVNSYLTITDHTNTTKNYKASDSTAQGTGTTGTSSGTTVVYYRNGNSLNATANNLRSAILSANGHGSSKFSISTGNPLTVTSKASGIAGNSGGASTAISDTGLVDADLTYTQFTGGVNEVTTNSFYSIADNTVTGNITKRYQLSAENDTGKATGTTGLTTNGLSVVFFNKASSNNITMQNLETAIESSNGHNGSITVSRSSAVLTLTQATTGSSGNLGNNDILTNSFSGFSDTGFSGGSFTAGQTPDKYLQVTDAAGTVRRYHAATSESQNSTATIGGVIYVYFTNSSTPSTVATNLKSAIESSNGHNGSISVSRSGAVLTLTITTSNNQAISKTLGNNLVISNAGSVSNGVHSWNTSNNLTINVASNEAIKIGRGAKIYDSSINLIGTVASVSGNAITLTSAPAIVVTSTLYVNQPKEALYLEEIFKISMSYNRGTVTLFINGFEVAKEKTHIINFQLDSSDCKIGRGTNNQEQFYGELYEIAYHKGREPCASNRTLTPSYNDILFYYRFGG
tara:strand:+ start:4813 stop:7764 length:2952 start_codon:yes stop_codon:yes gene_type:complete